MLIGFVATLAGAGLDVADTTGVTLFTIPFEWARLLWIIAVTATFIIVPFLAFHRMRLRYDALVQQTTPTRRLAECKKAMREHADKGNTIRSQGYPDKAVVLEWGTQCQLLLEQYLGTPIANEFLRVMHERLLTPSANETPIEMHVLIGEIHWLFARADEIKETDIML